MSMNAAITMSCKCPFLTPAQDEEAAEGGGVHSRAIWTGLTWTGCALMEEEDAEGGGGGHNGTILKQHHSE